MILAPHRYTRALRVPLSMVQLHSTTGGFRCSGSPGIHSNPTSQLTTTTLFCHNFGNSLPFPLSEVVLVILWHFSIAYKLWSYVTSCVYLSVLRFTKIASSLPDSSLSSIPREWPVWKLDEHRSGRLWVHSSLGWVVLPLRGPRARELPVVGPGAQEWPVGGPRARELSGG